MQKVVSSLCYTVVLGYPFKIYQCVHVIPNSLTIPTNLSPIVTVSLFSKFVSLEFSFVNKFICIIFFFKIPHINDICMIFVFLWLTSLNMIVSRSIHIAANGIISFFLMAEYIRVGQDWATSLSIFTFIHWRRKWQPTPVFLPGESQGLGNLVDCPLWGRTESDTTEATWQ